MSGKVQFDLTFIHFDHIHLIFSDVFSLVDHWQTLLDQLSHQLVNGFGVPTLLLVKFNFVQTHAIIDRKMSGYWMLSWAVCICIAYSATEVGRASISEFSGFFFFSLTEDAETYIRSISYQHFLLGGGGVWLGDHTHQLCTLQYGSLDKTLGIVSQEVSRVKRKDLAARKH